MNQALRKREETEDIYRRNIDAVYRVCMLFFKGSRADAEDAAQSTFLKLMKSPVRFENAAHLLQLVHEVFLIVQPARRVAKQHIPVSRLE